MTEHEQAPASPSRRRSTAPQLICTIVVLSTGLGCVDPASDADEGADTEEVRCEGDRWTSEPSVLPELSRCTTITGNLSVTSSDTLDLPHLSSIGGFLTIWVNPMLTHVSLPKLKRIGGFLDVSENAALTSLRLPALETVNDRDIDSVWDVAIKDNAVLPACQAEAVRDRLVARGFKGTVSVSGAPGTCSP